MNTKEVLQTIGVLKQAGFGYNENPNLKMLVRDINTKEGSTLEDLKSFEAAPEDDLSEDELFEIYFIIHQMHDAEKNQAEAILFLLRSIKYKPKEISIRQRYLNIFLRFISSVKYQIRDEDRIEIFKEFLRFKEYSKMTWGGDSDIYKYSETIIKELDCEQIEAPSEDLEVFIYRWIEINRRFRPDKQALDYASQLIYNIKY
ncbi:MAG: hypothetical protein ABJK11_08015 [Balneola sp.]